MASQSKQDEERRVAARKVRAQTVEEFHDAMAEAGITRAWIASENGEIRLSHPKLLAPVQAFFELSHDFADHEAVFLGREEGLPTVFLAAVHNTRRGLAQGGLRFKPYENFAELLVDGLRLAQGMTRKSALAGLWWGGGKGIIPMTEGLRTDEFLDLDSPRRRDLFQGYSRWVASLGGVYYTAEDVGTKTADMNAMLGAGRFITCVGSELGGSGNPSPFTARGVLRGMQAGWRFITGSDDLTGVRVAVQGVGNVGGPLLEELDDLGAQVFITDIDREALEAHKAKRPRLEIIDAADVYDLDADIFAPCAIGNQANIQTIPRFKFKLICGAANNILGEPADAERLRERGIAYVPDYLVNRMGITNCCDEAFGYLPDDVRIAAERVYPDALRVLQHARKYGLTSAEAADELADLASCELHPMIGHRGRRIIDRLISEDWAQARRGRSDGDAMRPAFDHGLDEPAIRVAWERAGRFATASGHRPAVAAAPVSVAGRPELSGFLPAVLADIRARSIELSGRTPRRRLGSDPGGLGLEQAVERSIPYEPDEIGRARFVELCQDLHRRHDEAVRNQLHKLGVGFDPQQWIEPTNQRGADVVKRLYLALQDAGLVYRQRCRTYFDPAAQSVLVVTPEMEKEWEDTDFIRGRRREDLIDQGMSAQVFVRLDAAADHLRQALRNGSIACGNPRWRKRIEEHLDDLEPWCVSRQAWWGHDLPAIGDDPVRGDVLSVWFTLAAWSLEAMGWPEEARPEPIDELFVSPDLLVRWVVPSLLVGFVVAGRPVYRRIRIHGALFVPVRKLEEREGASEDQPDEERYVMRRSQRRMRRQTSSWVEPETLISRFGADALRLGLVLTHQTGNAAVANAAEPTLERARRTVRRLNNKISGLCSITADPQAEGDSPESGRLSDGWIRARAEQTVKAALHAYESDDMEASGPLLVDLVDDLGRWATIAAQRPRTEQGIARLRATCVALIETMASGFEPMCPYLFDKLVPWTRQKSEQAGTAETAPALDWLPELVNRLTRSRRRELILGSGDEEILQILRGGIDELRALSRAKNLSVGEPQDEAKSIGPIELGVV